jgi:pimeloyl-ACP methyl ester carboxylesterase
MTDDIRTANALGRALRWRALTVKTPDEIAISAQDWGEPGRGRDVLLIHGYSQSHLSWLKQAAGPFAKTHRVVTYDLRGHGGSDKPLDPVFYKEGARWAGEVQAVIDAAELERPVLIAHSYAGRIALDYLQTAPADAISGLVMVTAASKVDRTVLGDGVKALVGMTAADLPSNIAATETLLRICVGHPLSTDEFAFALAFNMLTPAAVRAAMARQADYEGVLRAITVPVLTVHGSADVINLPAMSQNTLSLVPNGRGVWYEGVGHLPFWEASERFDADVTEFIAGLG